MTLPRDEADVLSARWAEDVLLKRDVFSTVERGRFRKADGDVEAVLRRIDLVPWWSIQLRERGLECVLTLRIVATWLPATMSTMSETLALIEA